MTGYSDEQITDGCMCDSDDCPECGTACTHCDGEGWGVCWDEIQCGAKHKYGWCPCHACGGTGLRSMQRVF